MVIPTWMMICSQVVVIWSAAFLGPKSKTWFPKTLLTPVFLLVLEEADFWDLDFLYQPLPLPLPPDLLLVLLLILVATCDIVVELLLGLELGLKIDLKLVQLRGSLLKAVAVRFQSRWLLWIANGL